MTGIEGDHKDVLEVIRNFFEGSAFHRLLGIRIESLDMERPCIKIEMKENLVGDYVHGYLHGGVISSVLDLTGGLITWLIVAKKFGDRPVEDLLKHLSITHTVDFRVDFLRPGTGKYFLSTGYNLRFGKKIAVNRMEFRNDKDILMAVATGAYVSQ